MLILSAGAAPVLLHRLFAQQMKLPHTKKSGPLTKYLTKVLTLQFAGWSWLVASNSQHRAKASHSWKVTRCRAREWQCPSLLPKEIGTEIFPIWKLFVFYGV